MSDYVRHPDQIYTLPQPIAEFDGRDGQWGNRPLGSKDTRYIRADVVEPKIQDLEEKNAALEAHIERVKEAFLDADAWEDVRDLFKTLPEASLARRDSLVSAKALKEAIDKAEREEDPEGYMWAMPDFREFMDQEAKRHEQGK